MTKRAGSPPPAALASRPYLEAAAALRPLIRSYQAETERGRRIPLPLLAQLKAAGLYRLLVPARLGGAQLDLASFFRLLELTAEGDGAVGWNLSTSAMLGAMALTLPDAGVAEIYAQGPDVCFSGATAPFGGQAEAVAGGYRVSGRWRFGSGCREADWLGGGCQVVEHSEPRRRPDVEPEYRRVYVAAADCAVVDTWDVSGLSGTGSHDWTVSELFVPERRTQRLDADWHRWPGTLYTLQPFGVIAGLHFSAVATGIARAGIDALVELAGTKKPAGAAGLLRDSPQTQDWLGRAEAMLGAARAYRKTVVGDVWATAEAGATVTRGQYARCRMAASYAVDCAVQAVDLMYRAGGSTVIERDNRLGRCWRDVHVIGQNLNVGPEFYGSAGRTLLGLEP